MTPPPPDIEPIDAAPAPAWQPLTLRDWPLVVIGCAGIAAWLTHIIAAIHVLLVWAGAM